MVRVMFVCHGNICRSPMAEFVMKDLVKRMGIEDLFQIASCATSREEIGNPVHSGTRKKLNQVGISCQGKVAKQLTLKDYEDYDYLVAMDQRNLTNINRIIGHDSMKKVSLLLAYTNTTGDIADPWYTGDFEKTYVEVSKGCEGLISFILNQQKNY